MRGDFIHYNISFEIGVKYIIGKQTLMCFTTTATKKKRKLRQEL